MCSYFIADENSLWEGIGDSYHGHPEEVLDDGIGNHSVTTQCDHE